MTSSDPRLMQQARQMRSKIEQHLQMVTNLLEESGLTRFSPEQLAELEQQKSKWEANLATITANIELRERQEASNV